MPGTTYIFDHKRDDETFGGRLSVAREASGLEVVDLASRLSVKAATVKGWESDRAAPSAHRLPTIAGMLGVSLAWLMDGRGPAPSTDAQADPDSQLNGQLEKLKQLQDNVSNIILDVEREIARRSSAA